MKAKKYINSVLIIMLCTLTFTTSSVCLNKATAEQPATTSVSTSQQELISPLVVVQKPSTYLNKKISMKAKFDKFTTLGLDYKTAMRSSDKYISFMVKRDDTTHDIPLSEMKLFLKREVAEKYVNLKSNDEISINGFVFSDALGDAWVDVESISILKKAPDKDGDTK